MSYRTNRRTGGTFRTRDIDPRELYDEEKAMRWIHRGKTYRLRPKKSYIVYKTYGSDAINVVDSKDIDSLSPEVTEIVRVNTYNANLARRIAIAEGLLD
jgi:hypothetical protein